MEWNGIMMFDVVFARKACMADSHELTIIINCVSSLLLYCTVSVNKSGIFDIMMVTCSHT